MDHSPKPIRPNPQRGAWFGSQLFFAWIVPLLWNGSRNGLNAENLTECLPIDKSADLGERLEVEWFHEQRQANAAKRSPQLKRALLRTFSTSILPEGFMFFFATISRSFMPFVLARLLILFQQPASANPRNVNESVDRSFLENAVQSKSAVAGFLGVVTFLSVICYHHAEMSQRMLGAKVRIACCSLIYRKTLRMSKLAASQTSAGYLINLLSNDVNRFDLGFLNFHYIWILPIQVSLITYLIYYRIGWAAFVSVACLLIQTMPVQTYLSRVFARIRLRVAVKTDERVGIMHEIVQGIQVIKMYAWEPFFQSIVLKSRKEELKQVLNASHIHGYNFFSSVFAERTTLFLTIITCSMTGQSTTADVVFSMAQFFNVLMLTMVIFYPLALAFGGEALISITRIEDFLLLDELAFDSTSSILNQCFETDHLTITEKKKNTQNDDAIELTKVSAVWNSMLPEKTLDEVTFKVRAGTLCAVVGSVGAGKSSLLHLLLDELPLVSGRVTMKEKTTISYASQDPWLFSGTVRNNILFGESYDQQRYDEVVHSCSLDRDFELLPNADQTMVGERGSSLSGGQRARIGLARAIYKKASVYLLDDPLSAVDAHVGKHLFENVIGPRGWLAKTKATRILVTHQVHLLQNTDHIVVLDHGRIAQQGTYTELTINNSNISFTSFLVKSKEDNVSVPDEEIIEENNHHATKLGRTNLAYSNDSDEDTEYEITRENHLGNANDEVRTSTAGAFHIWWQYLTSGSSLVQIVLMIGEMVMSQIMTSATDFYLSYWTEREVLRLTAALAEQSRDMDLIVYGILLMLLILFVFLRSAIFFRMCVQTSKALHLSMLTSLLGAQLRFFDSNPSGRILNRFSKDLGAMDETLPYSVGQSFQNILIIIGILCVVSILNPAMLIVLAGSVVCGIAFMKLYLRPAQDLKRLEGITRSPVFSHMSASLSGISTIRSCGMESTLVSEFDGLQDVHSAVWRLIFAANTGLGLWLDILSVLFFSLVAFSFIYIFTDASSAIVGMALSQAMILTNYVQFAVRQATLAIQQLTSVERVLEYTKLDGEIESDVEPVADWPQTGQICFTNLSLRYHPDSQRTLSDMTIEIQSGWKIGIVGRTGAGKSSIIAALFRLAINDGTISIDGIDTSSISLKSLRSRISIIPQEPVLFSATIRSNLDPFNYFSDDELWKALGAVELKSSVPALDFVVTEAGSNFSIGQRQLICLARAILRKDRILVLDEATANVDPQTDALIQRTIRERFVNSTVLTIAHRLRTVMDSDRILVLDAGRILEFDEPHVLLQNPDGVFSQMVAATGQEADSLRELAKSPFGGEYDTFKQL